MKKMCTIWELSREECPNIGTDLRTCTKVRLEASRVLFRGALALTSSYVLHTIVHECRRQWHDLLINSSSNSTKQKGAGTIKGTIKVLTFYLSN